MNLIKTSIMALVAVGLGVGAVSCGANDPAAANGSRGKTLEGTADTTRKKNATEGEVRIPEAPVARKTDPNGGFGAPAIAPEAAPAPKAADLSDMPLAPKDAKWTIYCETITGPGHVEAARERRIALVKDTGMREWYLLHENDQSRMYYGYYRNINDQADKAESARAQSDRKKIDSLSDGTGRRPFQACQFVQLSAPDPESPGEWNLVNAPTDRVWTLMIAAYKDHPDRKKFAVDAVRDARAQGIEAYYYHGDNVSNVMVGAWPEDAVIEQRLDPNPGAGKGGRGDVFVVPPGMKPPEDMRDKQGRPVRAVSQQLVIVDDAMKQKAEEFPEFSVNGESLVYNAKGKTWTERTKVVRIPRPSDTLFRDNVAADADQAEPDPLSRPGYQDTSSSANRAPRKAAGPGQLRSIQDQDNR